MTDRPKPTPDAGNPHRRPGAPGEVERDACRLLEHLTSGTHALEDDAEFAA